MAGPIDSRFRGGRRDTEGGGDFFDRQAEVEVQKERAAVRSPAVVRVRVRGRDARRQARAPADGTPRQPPTSIETRASDAYCGTGWRRSRRTRGAQASSPGADGACARRASAPPGWHPRHRAYSPALRGPGASRARPAGGSATRRLLGRRPRLEVEAVRQSAGSTPMPHPMRHR